MARWHMITVVGQDRPGIVAGLTDVLFRAGANLGEASMARLGGNFAVMLMVEANAETAAVHRWLAPVAQQFSLHVHVDAIEGRLHAHVEPNVRVIVHGADRPGIVAQVTAALLPLGFNILDLQSDVGGNAAQPIYVLLLEGRVEGDIAALETALGPLRSGGIEVRATAIDTMVG